MTQTASGRVMLEHFNLGGHFGCVHRVWVEEHIAPILTEAHGF